ncbi:hypothetical protein GLOIN_2v1786842 [Rhizophagus irregularis DAOM 181602=DAOM 197198]|nr:hypothetical protein GLOIN_2v1786842 [Rhizophagus irregularis DAOM 181602=DAOM 197198]
MQRNPDKAENKQESKRSRQKEGNEESTQKSSTQPEGSVWDVTTNINIDQYIKINASSIQNDQYIVYNAIYEVLTQAEYGAMKNLSISDIKIGSAFLIDSPLNIEFNCRIEDNSSSNKIKLVVIALSLMVYPKVVNAMIYTDSQWVINIFDNLYMMLVSEIEKSKVNYKIL